MTYPTDQDELNVCRHLGLSDDQESHATYATDAHRCFKLDTPTKIATQHQERFCLGAEHPNCPIFKGEGLARTGRAGGAGAAAAAGSPFDRPSRPSVEPESSATKPVRAPRAPQRPSPDKPFKVGGGPGFSPRPRAGGISMRTMTIGLFILAAVVLALAFLIQNVVGGDDGKTLTPAEVQQTQAALKPTTPATSAATRTAGTGTATASPANSATATAQANRTATGSATTGTSTAPAAGTYTVKAGDNCGIIAEATGVTVDQLRQLNPAINESCGNLQPGQVLKLK